MNLEEIGKRVSAARAETLARGETFYPGASRVHLAAFPPKERWDDWTYTDSRRVGRRTMLVPTTCFNCESACGLLAYIDRETLAVRKFEGNPGFRQPVLRAARERLGSPVADTREVNPGEVWEENEFWIELSWRIDPDGVAGHPPVLRVAGTARGEADRRRVLRVDIRALGAGAAGTRVGRGADPAGVHAPLRGVRDLLRRRRHARAAGAGRGTAGHRRGPLRPCLYPCRCCTGPERGPGGHPGRRRRRPPPGRRPG